MHFHYPEHQDEKIITSHDFFEYHLDNYVARNRYLNSSQVVLLRVLRLSRLRTSEISIGTYLLTAVQSTGPKWIHDIYVCQ